MPHLSPEKRARIATLLEEGYSTRQIADREGLSHTAVWKIGKRAEKYHTYRDLPRSGRPRRFTEREERKIVRLVKSGKCETAVDVQSQLRAEEDVNVSTNTLRRIFQRHDLVARVKRKKPLLTRAHRRRRLTFAQEHKDWTTDDWRRVVWSDESKFQLFGSDGRKWYWKTLGQPLNDRSIKPTVKYGGGNIMVWGCLTARGLGNLCRIDGRLDGKLYREILDKEFKGTLNSYKMNRSGVIFQQDNDPKHTAKLTLKWFQTNRIERLEWPSQSPDLNPIEHVWNEVDRRLRHLPSKITSKDDLWEKLQDVWKGVELDFCVKLIETMPERVRDVLKAKGGYTRW
jgi:transposase